MTCARPTGKAHRAGDEHSLQDGKHVLSIQVRRNVAAGPVKLTLTLSDEAGNKLTVKRQAKIPRLPVAKKHRQ